MSDGVSVRCQAVSKTKLAAERERLGNPDLTPDEAWPAAQCERAAVPGKLVCGGRGGHGGGSLSVPSYDITSFMPTDMREMLQTVMEQPHLISRRFEMYQLVARYLTLYKRLSDDEALGPASLVLINEGLEEIEKGESIKGIAKIRGALDKRIIEHETYEEIRKVMALLKDMTKVEVASIKEMRAVVTIDQVIALVNAIADATNRALEEFVEEPEVRTNVANAVAREAGRRLNAGVGPVFPEIDRIEIPEGGEA